jgi:hypothetical protein
MENSDSKKLTEAPGSFELGIFLGQRKAFGVVAGRSSAAEAVSIRRIREERLYQASGLHWEQFCKVHLSMSRAQADRLIRYLDEFGPEYFELTQLTRISPDAYRAIAPAVKDGHIHWQNEAIALLPENSDKVAAAVAALRDAAKSDTAPDSPMEGTDLVDHMNDLKRRGDLVAAEWRELVERHDHFAPGQQQLMRHLISQTRQDLEHLEYQAGRR